MHTKCSLSLAFLLPIILGLVTSDAQVSKRPLIFHNWPPKNSKQISGKQRTLVVQIRSDQPVPLMFKGRPSNFAQHAHNHAHPHAHTHSHLHALPHPMALHSVPLTHLRNVRPIKLSAPVYLKPGPIISKPLLRKPLKIKLNNAKIKSKPVTAFEKPFKFEKPTTEYYYELQSTTENERNKLPLETTFHLLNDRYAPIHTIPAPNLSLQDNHLHAEDIQEENKSINKTKTQQKSQSQQQSQSQTIQIQESSKNQYQVFEEQSNDQTIIDPHSNTQKLFAPDPDPSLPTSKLKLATEHFNKPSNGKPLPADVQSNHLPVAQPLVLAQPDLYPIQITQQAAALQPFISANLAAIQPAAPIPLYNPTYLVQQSNNLYTQHKQQLFNTPVVEAGYYNADLTQAVAPDGSIVQPSVDTTPQFAPLVSDQTLFQPAAIRLPNTVVSSSAAPETGFVASHYYDNDSSQLLQAYAEEEAERQRLEAEEAAIQLEQHQQREQVEQELLLQQKHNHLLELQQQQQHQQQQNQQYLLQQQQQQQQQQLQQQQHQQQIQQQQQHQQQIEQQQQQHLAQQHIHQQDNNPATAAFEEHARLVQKQLGTDTPLRIFVPDDEAAVVDLPRLHKRSDQMKKGSVEDVVAGNRAENSKDKNNMGIEVSSSVEVSNENHSSASKTDKRMDKYDEQNTEQK